MRHAREDYDRFQDPEGKIPDDEPVLLIRGQDALAIGTLDHYASQARLNGLDDIADRVEAHMVLMREWQVKIGGPKMPDIPD